MSDGLSVEFKVKLGNGRAGHRRIRGGDSPGEQEAGGDDCSGAPYVARMVALAHHFDELIQRGEVRDYAEIARLAGVTRAWVTQVMGLLFLAPDIQEDMLFISDRSGVSFRRLRGLTLSPTWETQRTQWRSLTRASEGWE